MWRIYLGMSLFPNHVTDVRFWARRIVQEFVESFRGLNCILRSLFWKDSYIIYRSLVARTICSFKIKFFCCVTLSQRVNGKRSNTSFKAHSPLALSRFLPTHSGPCPVQRSRAKSINNLFWKGIDTQTTKSSHPPPQAAAPPLPFAARGLVVSETSQLTVGTVVVFPVVTCLTCSRLQSISAARLLTGLDVLLR